MAFGEDAFGDVFGQADAVADDLYARAGEFAPDAVHDDLVRGRIARKTGTEAPRQSTDPWVDYEDQRRRLKAGTRQSIAPAQPTTPQDFSSEGTPVDATAKKPVEQPQPSEEASPEEVAPVEQPSRGLAERAGVVGRAAGQAAVEAGGESLKGAAVLTSRRTAYEPYYNVYQVWDKLHPDAQIDVRRRVANDDHLNTSDKAFIQSRLTDREQGKPAEPIEQFAGVPAQERELYKAGEKVSKFAEKTFPLTDEEKASVEGKIGSFVGGAAPAVALTGIGAAVGMPELGMVAGAAQMGTQSAGTSFERALAAGATPEEAARAAGLDALVGGGLGVLPLGAILAPVRAAGTPILDAAGNEIGRKIAPGLLGWMAAKLEQGVKAGVTFAGVGEAQEWLSKQIATEYNGSARVKLRSEQAKLKTEIEKVEAFPNLAAANAKWLEQANAAVKKYDEQIENPSQYEVDPERIAISFFGGGALGMLHPHGMVREEPAVAPLTPPGTPPAVAPGVGPGPGPGGPGPGIGGPGAATGSAGPGAGFGARGGIGGPGARAEGAGAGPETAGAGAGPRGLGDEREPFDEPGFGDRPQGGYPSGADLDTPRQAKMRETFEHGLQSNGVVGAGNLPFDQLRDTYQAADGLRTGFGRADLAGKSPAELTALFDQLSALKEHGFGYTPEDLRSLPPDQVAREYADTVRATKPDVEATPPVPAGHYRFFHGADPGSPPTTGGGRWVTRNADYARNFRSEGEPKDVWYVDIPKGAPAEVAARQWTAADEAAGINNVGTHAHTELPQVWAKRMQRYTSIDDLPPAAPRYRPGATVGAMGGELTAAIKDFWTSTFQPELVSDRALEADPLFARYKSAQAQEKDAIIRQFDKGWRYWNKKPDAARFRFLEQMERGVRTGNGYEDAQMRAWRRLLDENWAEEQRWGSTASFVDDYVPHVWEKPSQWRAFSQRKAAQLGPTWFQKGRTFDYISEGLAAGLKLKYTNPADLIVHRLLSGVDMRQRMQLLYMLKPMGLAWEGQQGGQQLMRRGWAPINAPDRKQWMVHPDVALLWKNAVEAQGLWAAENYGGSVFRGWMALKNAWVPVKLGLSAFHPLHVLHINQAEMLTQAARSARQGDFADALKELGEGLATIPTLGLPSYRKGRIIKQAWEKRPADQTTEERAIVGLLNEMGITAQLSEQLRIDGERKLAESWARITRGEGTLGDKVLLTPRMVARAIKFLSSPVFEHWIPALKVNAAIMEAQAALRRDPSLLTDPVRRRLALRAIGKSIENRFGEMFYGSLFWNRYVKDAGIASFLSLGWNLGFAREFIGGAAEAITRPVGAVGRATGISGLTPSPQRQTIRDNTSKMGFAFTYLLTAALINGLMSYLLSDKAPEGWDWIFARVGGENPDGSPRRITNMTYLREIPMLMKHIQEHGGNILAGAGEMLWTKLMFEPFKEIWENRDYYGYNIRDENAPWYKQVWQTIVHGFGDTTPISVSSAQRALDTGGTWSKDVVLAVLGFGPAPAYAEKSAIQNRIAHLYNQHVAPQSRTYQEGEVSHEKMRARTRLLQALHSKDPEAIKQARAEAIKAGYSAEAVGHIGRTPSDVFLFSKLPEADQEAILRQANPTEFDRYVGHAKKKIRAPMREEHAGKQPEAPAPGPSSTPAPRPSAPATVAPAPRSAAPPPPPPPRSAPPPPPPPRGRTRADDLLQTSPLR